VAGDRLGARTLELKRAAARSGASTVVAVVAAVVMANSPASAGEAAEFYAGKTITIEVGYGPGGGYDVTTRLFAQYFGQHIPGHPSVIVQNLPGGGGLKVANAIFNTAAKDGLTLGVFTADVAMEPLYGDPQALFTADKFAWIGSMDTDVLSCGVWKGAGVGIRTLPDLIAAKKQVSFGSTGPGTDPSLYPTFFKKALGAPVRVVGGYTGTREIMLAMERGEMDGSCGLFESSVRGSYMHELSSGDLNIFVQIALTRKSPLFGDATPVMDVIKTDEMREIAGLVFGPSEITRPLAAPPGTPPDRVSALRTALIETAKDPRTIDAGKALQIALEPKSGEEVERLIRRFQSTPPELVKAAFAYTHD
jgi:tripartite-type tricarboxylate transporter receptor subunit TctC